MARASGRRPLVAGGNRNFGRGLLALLATQLALGLAGCDAPKMAKAPPQDQPRTETTQADAKVQQRRFEYQAEPAERDAKQGAGRVDDNIAKDDAPAASAPAPRPEGPGEGATARPSPPRLGSARPAPPPPAGGAAPPPPAGGAAPPRQQDQAAAQPAPPRTRNFSAKPPGAAGGGGAPAPVGQGAPAPAPLPKNVESAPAAAPPPPKPDAGVTKPGTAVVDEKTDWDVVPVFFGTDRARATDPKRIAYGSDRGRKLELGRALITVPKAHEVPNIERPWAIKVPYFDVKLYEQAEDPKKHFTMKEIQSLTRDQFLSFVRERLATSSRYKDHAVIFVHGYNTSFDSAIYRTAQMAYDLKFDGAPFLYSWPSGGTFESYTYDRESAGQSQPFMRDFLNLVVKETGAKSVSIIAHSMGNQPVLQILRDLKYSKPEGVVISQIILAAPDVDRDNFENIAAEIKGMAKGVTLYAASNDRALSVSRRFNGGIPRAGDVPATGPMILSGIDTIDVTAAGMEGLYLNHSSYAENNALLSDIGLIIQTGERPPDKRFPILQKMTTSLGEYWKYPPKR